MNTEQELNVKSIDISFFSLVFTCLKPLHETAACLLWCCITCIGALIVSLASWANCLVVSIYRHLLVIKIGFSVVGMAKTLELMSLGTAAQIATIINNIPRFSLYFSGDVIEMVNTGGSLSHVVCFFRNET